MTFIRSCSTTHHITEEVITDDVQTETVDVSDEIIETSQATEE